MTTKRLRLLLPGVGFVAMLILGNIPGWRQALHDWVSGLVLHVVAYGVLSVFFWGILSGSPSVKALRVIASVMVLGALDEYVQSFFPYRCASWNDWAVDVLTAIVVAGLMTRAPVFLQARLPVFRSER